MGPWKDPSAEGDTTAMRTITRRLRRLEERFTPQKNGDVVRLVALIRERRRSRLEASGEPFEVRSCEALTDEQSRQCSHCWTDRQRERAAISCKQHRTECRRCRISRCYSTASVARHRITNLIPRVSDSMSQVWLWSARKTVRWSHAGWQHGQSSPRCATENQT